MYPLDKTLEVIQGNFDGKVMMITFTTLSFFKDNVINVHVCYEKNPIVSLEVGGVRISNMLFVLLTFLYNTYTQWNITRLLKGTK